jgi:hypothetical protein
VARKRKIFDTSVFITHWKKRGQPKLKGLAPTLTVAAAARELIELHGIDNTVTPVKMDFLCGGRSKEEMTLFKLYLDFFLSSMTVIFSKRTGPKRGASVSEFPEMVSHASLAIVSFGRLLIDMATMC